MRWTEAEAQLNSHCRRGFNPDGSERDCPGYGRECKPPDRPILGHAKLSQCPRAMLASPTWQEVAMLQRASHVSPIAGFPNCMTYGGLSAVIAVNDAIEDLKRDMMQQATQGPATSAGGAKPRFNGTTSTRK